jgi:uncharacterized protein YlxW (UPF0749 family)
MALRSRALGRGAPGRSRHARRPLAGLLGEFLVLAIAGFLFVTSATTANGTQLRSDRADAVGLLRAEQSRYEAQAKQAAALQREVDSLTARAALGDSAVGELQSRSQNLLVAAGMRPMRGPGLTVTLDDAPRTSALPSAVRPDDLVVHQQDVQAVVNALWAGGAEAIRLMDQRVISTSAVRCVGNTLILQGRVYSPPYRVTAIGNIATMQRALDESPQVGVYQEYVQAVGLGWSVVRHAGVTVPAYTGSLELRYAQAPQQADGGASEVTRSPLGTGTSTEAGTQAP